MFSEFKSKILCQKKQAFSIAELSVVIVASGLMIFGVLKTGDIVSKARVNAVISEINEIKSAVQNFQSVNLALPGDIGSNIIKKQTETNITLTNFGVGNSDGVISWGAGSATGTINESLAANAALVHAGYIGERSVSNVNTDYAYGVAASAVNILKSSKLNGVNYTIFGLQKSGSDELAFATPKNSSINFAGNNIVIGGLATDSTTEALTLNASTASGYFINNVTNVPSAFSPTVPNVSKKVVDGLVDTFGSAIRYCNSSTALVGACTDSDTNVASLALLSL